MGTLLSQWSPGVPAGPVCGGVACVGVEGAADAGVGAQPLTARRSRPARVPQPCSTSARARSSTWPTWTRPQTPRSGRTPLPPTCPVPTISSFSSGCRAAKPRYGVALLAALSHPEQPGPLLLLCGACTREAGGLVRVEVPCARSYLQVPPERTQLVAGPQVPWSLPPSPTALCLGPQGCLRGAEAR